MSVISELKAILIRLLAILIKIKFSLGGIVMGRSNNHQSSSRKSSLPQTPKNLKTEPNNNVEEFSRELDESTKIRPTRPK